MTTFREARDLKYGLALGTNFQGVIADSGPWLGIDCEHFDIKFDTKIYTTPGAHANKNQVNRNTVHKTGGSMPNFTISGDVDIHIFDLLAGAHFQLVSQASSPGYTKTYSYHTTCPDFGADAGIYLNVVKVSPDASKSHKVGGAVTKRLALTWERSNPLKFEAEMVANGSTLSLVSNPSNITPTVEGTDSFGRLYDDDIVSAQMNLGAGLADILISGFSVEGSQDVIPVSIDGTGGFLSLGLTNRAITGSVSILYDEKMNDANDALQAGTDIVLDVDFGAVTVVLKGKITEVVSTTDGAWGATITIVGEASTTSANDALVITVTNQDDRGW
jgi:hypothetical protein